MLPSVFPVLFRSVADFRPDWLPGLAAWYDASAGDTLTVDSVGRVSQWNDRGPHARHVSHGTVANQPVFLPWAGENYAYQNNTQANRFTTTDTAANSPSTQLDLKIRISPRSWTDNAVLVDKLYTAGQRAYRLFINAGGAYSLQLSADGTASSFVTSDNVIAGTAGLPRWLRATWRASDGRVQFFESVDATSWVQNGANKTIAIASIHDSTDPLVLGTPAGGTNSLDGYLHRFQLSTTIDAAPTVDFDPTRYVSGPSFVASTGEGWTINGGAAIVTRPTVYGDGVNDSLRATFTLPQPVTWLAVVNPRTWTSGRYLLDGANGAGSGGLVQTTSTPRVSLHAGSAAAENANLALQSPAIVQAVINGASSSLQINGTTATTGNPGATNPGGITLFADGAATAANFAAASISEYIAYNGVLDPAQILRLRQYLAAKWRIAA